MKKPSQVLVNAALAGLIGVSFSVSQANASGSAQKAVQKGQCWGANTCKGKTECATAKHSCHTKNECKGQGWLKMSKAECMELKKTNSEIKFKES